jgi:murein L,D-transpeptidase YafK
VPDTLCPRSQSISCLQLCFFWDLLPPPRTLSPFATSNCNTRESAPPPKKRTPLSGACAKKKKIPIRRVLCATSGVLGPKRKFGDAQVPEGFYELDWFNPQSNFFLSLHISYPNSADRILGSYANPGGDIFLHGNCVTIGCIPITDEGIKEVYWLAVEVHAAGQRHIPIEIFPLELTAEGFKSLEKSHPNQPELLAFWRNLREGFDLFEKDHRALRVRVASDGRYEFDHQRGSLASR